ncbi:MAG: FAD-binding oxidoreductase [Balneolaceae bacterium]|nr:FAD-binding oxidoreductase [Balneolaceae bacterium]
MPQSIQIKKDEQTRRLYANDASMYEEIPQGVAFPTSADEIQQLVRLANRQGVSITARSAGTSLAGQTTGNGMIMDVSRHMTSILELDPQNRIAHLQPGVIRDTLNRKASKYNLLFGPDTATTNRCMLGGMIGNNSCGSFSIKYGTTREHILEIDAVLSDGSYTTFKPLSPGELEAKKQLDNLEGHIYRSITKLIEENREAILKAYPHPEIIRRNTGYALDKLCSMQPFNPDGRPFNMAELLCGSEGTLAMTASAKVNLEQQDPEKLVIVPHFNSIREAMEATVDIVKYDPAAVELVDHFILEATKGNIEQRKNRFFLEGDPHCILIRSSWKVRM